MRSPWLRAMLTHTRFTSCCPMLDMRFGAYVDTFRKVKSSLSRSFVPHLLRTDVLVLGIPEVNTVFMQAKSGVSLANRARKPLSKLSTAMSAGSNPNTVPVPPENLAEPLPEVRSFS